MYSIFSADEKTKNGPCFLFPVICRRIFFSEKKRNNQNKVALRKKLLFLHWLLLLYGRLRRSWFMFCSLHFTECQKYQPNPRKLVGNTWKEESVKSVQFSEIFYTSILSFLFEENVRNSSRLEFLKRFSNVRFFYLTTHIHS